MKGIDSGQIAAMTAQMRSAVSGMQKAAAPAASLGITTVAAQPGGFAQALKTQLDQVNGLDQEAQKLGERFSLGDNSVNLSDVMIATQKSSIAMQATIQVRNKLVAAYHDIMNMQV
jgi:flagellar hook-basal body complex protein FliE